jgi:hypothetical protein
MRMKMWQPSFAQPKMTMEEHGENEYRLMIAKQERMKKAQEQERLKLKRIGVDDPEDIDNPIVSEMKTYKARAWDAFKDENEKGGGNKGNN